MKWHNWAIVWAVSHREGSRGLGLTHQAHLPSPALRQSFLHVLGLTPGLCSWALGISSASCWPLLHFSWPTFSTIAKAQHPGSRHRNPKLTPVLELVMATSGSATLPPEFVVGDKLTACGTQSLPKDGWAPSSLSWHLQVAAFPVRVRGQSAGQQPVVSSLVCQSWGLKCSPRMTVTERPCGQGMSPEGISTFKGLKSGRMQMVSERGSGAEEATCPLTHVAGWSNMPDPASRGEFQKDKRQAGEEVPEGIRAPWKWGCSLRPAPRGPQLSNTIATGCTELSSTGNTANPNEDMHECKTHTELWRHTKTSISLLRFYMDNMLKR